MSVTYTRERIRLGVDVKSQTGFNDIITGETPSMWRGTDLAVEVAFFYGSGDGAQFIDVSRFASITCEVRDALDRTSLVLATKTVAAVDLYPGLTADQWAAGTHQHVLFSWTAAEANWDLQQQQERTFWLVIHAITTDSPVRRVTLGGGNLRVVEDGAGEASTSPTPGDPLYLTADQTAALIGQVVRPGNNPAGMTITLTSPNGQWGRTIGVDNNGAPTDSIVRLT